jgi:5-methylcytosine-specific restriction protein A
MPRRPKSICRHRGCGALIEQPGFCEKHKQESVGWNRSHQGKSAAERGYDAEWRKKRERILHRDSGLCQPCLKHGIVHCGDEVDHIVSKAEAKRLGWTREQIEDDSNLQAINSECHKEKTARERRGWSR